MKNLVFIFTVMVLATLIIALVLLEIANKS